MNSLSLALLLPLLGGPTVDGNQPDEIGNAVTYRVRQTAVLDQIPEGAAKVQWWVSIPDDDRHQDVLDFSVVDTPGSWRIVRDADRGARFLYIEVDRPATDKLEAVVEFTLHREPVLVAVDPSKVGPITDLHRQWFAEDLVHDAPHMEVTPTIQGLADRVCGEERNPAVQAKALLGLVAEMADHYSKDPTKPNCGIGDAEDCLTNGGGCCTDLHSLFVALARARGLPARLQMGYRLLEKNRDKEVDPGYRCWVEYFLPGHGWVPADIVEADANGGLGPQRWFSGLTERRLWLNQGREFRLNPATGAAPVNTMIIGHAIIDGTVARVLPEGELKAQLTRRVHFVELP
jgi:hypothetical protein